MAVLAAPETVKRRDDQIFEWFLRFSSLAIIGIFFVMLVTLATHALISVEGFGLNYLFDSTWRPSATRTLPVQFGTFAFIFGTIVTSLIALALATPFAIGASIFVTEYAPRWLGVPISFCVELLVTIPSVVYGFWGMMILVPLMREHVQPFLQETVGHIPVIGLAFQGAYNGFGFLTAGVILAIMILPTIMALSKEIIMQVPRLQKEGVVALGATKWEVINMAILPFARSGILGAMILGLARAIGETMAVTMVIGNATRITEQLFSQGATLSSAIANQFTETNTDAHFSAVVGLGMILLVLASGFNILSRMMAQRITKMPGY